MNDLIVNSTTNIIYNIADDIINDIEKNGYYVPSEDLLYPYTLGITLHEGVTIPSGVAVGTHKYDGTGFTVNDDYVEPFDLEKVVKQQQDILDNLLVDSLMGGN